MVIYARLQKSGHLPAVRPGRPATRQAGLSRQTTGKAMRCTASAGVERLLPIRVQALRAWGKNSTLLTNKLQILLVVPCSASPW